MTEALDCRIHAWRPDLADAALEGRVDAARYVRGETRRIAAAQAAVRGKPDPAASMATEALCGEAVRIFETTANGFAWVQLQADSYVGYIEAASLGAPDPAPTHRVSALRTPVFSRPDIKSPPLAFLPLNAVVAVAAEAEDKNARYALLASGGAVVAQHLAALDAFEDDFVAVAERFLEAPYLWGGKTALGLDCSGLVQTALAACGIVAPRDTDMQETTLGAAANPAVEFRRGDLLFWEGHVAIATGADEILHANAHAMRVNREPAHQAITRAAARGWPLTAVRRLGQA
jgi:cell wall-associated NlpC family hydrolase